MDDYRDEDEDKDIEDEVCQRISGPAAPKGGERRGAALGRIPSFGKKFGEMLSALGGKPLLCKDGGFFGKPP